MDVLTSMTVSAASIELFSGSLFAIGLARRPADRGATREYALAVLLSFSAGLHSIGSLALLQGGTGSGHRVVLAGAAFASAGLVASPPLAVHVAANDQGARPSRRWIAAAYAIAAVCAVAARSGLIAWASHAVAIAGGAVTLVLVARTYLAGKREALAVVMGATMLVAATVNDFGVALGAWSTGYLIDAGLAAFIASIMSTRSARFAAVALELERRTDELRTRTHELGRSDEELRAAQEELVKKEQLAVVGELAAVIAHEVRNPLAIIANAVAGLRKQAISRDDHETLLAILDEETSRLNRLVTDLLRYARPINLQRTDFSLTDVLERALGLISKDRRAMRTDFKVDDVDARVFADANLLRQVFENLVVNAVQAMGSGGTLTVRVRAATEDGVSGVAVDIIDTGEGMDTQVRSRARDPFFTTRPSGTGLGLAIVDRIVNAHGGRLGIDSRAGEGTTVTVFLPHGSANESATPRPRTLRSVAEPRPLRNVT